MAKQSTAIENQGFIAKPDVGAVLSEDLRDLLADAASNTQSEAFISDREVLNSSVPSIDDNSRVLEARQADAVINNPKTSRQEKAHYIQLKQALHEHNESPAALTYIDGRKAEIPASTRDSANSMDPQTLPAVNGPRSSKLCKVLLGDALYARAKEWARKGNIRRTAMFLGPELYALLRSDAVFDLSAEVREKFEQDDNEESSTINQTVAKLFGQEVMQEARRLARFNKCSVHNIIVAFTELILEHRENKLRESVAMISGEDDI